MSKASDEATIERLRKLCLALPEANERVSRPPYVGPSGWVGVILDRRPDWKAVKALLRDAFVHVATKKLVALLTG